MDPTGGKRDKKVLSDISQADDLLTDRAQASSNGTASSSGQSKKPAGGKNEGSNGSASSAKTVGPDGKLAGQVTAGLLARLRFRKYLHQVSEVCTTPID